MKQGDAVNFQVVLGTQEKTEQYVMEAVEAPNSSRSRHRQSTLNDYASMAGGLQDGKMANYFFTRMQTVDRGCSVLALISILLIVLYFDANFDPQNEHQVFVSNLLLWVNMLVSTLLVVSEFLRQYARLDLQKSQLLADVNSTVWNNSNFWIPLILEPYPFLEKIYYDSFDLYDRRYFRFKLNYLLCIVHLFKIMIVLRALMNGTQYARPRAVRLSQMYGNDCGYTFIIKCVFKDSPVSMMLMVFFFQSVLFGIALRFAERTLDHFQLPPDAGDKHISYEHYLSCIWMIIITMTTVGYGFTKSFIIGDYYPRTPLGRLLISFIAIWGTFTVSIFVVMLTEALKLNSAESTALQMGKQLSSKDNMKNKAGEIIKFLVGIYKKHKVAKQRQSSENYVPQVDDGERTELTNADKKQQVELRDKVEEFKDACREVRTLYTKEDLLVEMENRFNAFEEYLGIVTHNQRKIYTFVIEHLWTQIDPMHTAMVTKRSRNYHSLDSARS